MVRLLLIALLTASRIALAGGLVESMERLRANADFVDVGGIAGVTVDLRYASRDNFTGVDLYGPFRHAFLHKLAADKLRVAAEQLGALHPGYTLLVLDATRPRSVQRKLWDHVRARGLTPYVSNPAKGWVHNFGFAADLSIADATGAELDMGTPFDTFSPLSHPAREAQFLREGRLHAAQVANRRLLRQVMRQAGFRQHPIEWWHYDALPAAAVRLNYPIIE